MTTLVDTELADAIKDLLASQGGRKLFRYGRNGEACNVTGAVLSDYVREYMGEEFTAKDFRTWGERRRRRSPSRNARRPRPRPRQGEPSQP